MTPLDPGSGELSANFTLHLQTFRLSPALQTLLDTRDDFSEALGLRKWLHPQNHFDAVVSNNRPRASHAALRRFNQPTHTSRTPVFPRFSPFKAKFRQQRNRHKSKRKPAANPQIFGKNRNTGNWGRGHTYVPVLLVYSGRVGQEAGVGVTGGLEKSGAKKG